MLCMLHCYINRFDPIAVLGTDNTKPMATQEAMNEDEARDYALQLTYSIALPTVLKSAVELGLLDIIDKAGPEAQLSSSKIASYLPTLNHEVSSSMIDRILYLLATFSIVTCSLSSVDEEGGKTRVYGLAPAGRFFLNGRQESLASMMELLCSSTSTKTWLYVKEATLEGGVAFIKAHGMPAFQYRSSDQKRSKSFNEAMAGVTTVSMKNLFDVYRGFEGVQVLVDVAGGIGALLNGIIIKYPSIKGINFDQPHVIQNAPSYAGVEHVGGDMFERVPNGDAILLRNVIHNWDDEHCVKVLNKCYEALEDDGKVIMIESVLPLTAETSNACKYAAELDLLMMVALGRAKERTEEEFRAISIAAGFTSFQLVCSVNANSIMELKK